MNISQSGIIIKTRHVVECIDFYRNVLGLDVLFATDFLTCFQWGASYLMIEPAPDGSATTRDEHLVLRCNVQSVAEERDKLVHHGILSFYDKFEWGEILTFFDPAGTKIELKDARSFDEQVRSGASGQRGPG
mgnify:CR=1 FL=1